MKRQSKSEMKRKGRHKESREFGMWRQGRGGKVKVLGIQR
jgi:hypothetical protein